MTVHLKSISIHAAREGGDIIKKIVTPSGMISIHAAREGGDQPVCYSFRSKEISIHAAREGGDTPVLPLTLRRHDFNPRRP